MDPKLIKVAKETFKAHPNAEQVLVTTDGQCFLPQAKDLANYHARKRGAKVISIDRSAVIEAKDAAPKPPNKKAKKAADKTVSAEQPQKEETTGKDAPEAKAEEVKAPEAKEKSGASETKEDPAKADDGKKATQKGK